MQKLALALMLAFAMAGCDDEPAPPDGDGDGDADGDSDGDSDGDGDADPPVCADRAERFVLPSPAWQGDGGLVAPADGDAAAELLRLRRPTWFEQLPGLDGWPARPLFALPLSAPASAVEASAVSAWARREGSGDFERLETTFQVELPAGGETLLIRPTLPLPEDIDEVILAIDDRISDEAVVLPACGADGDIDPAHIAALDALPDDSGALFALRIPLSRTGHQLRRIWDAQVAAPSLEVSEIATTTFDDFGDAAPSEEVAALLRADPLRGRLDLPDYRGEDGAFVVDEAGTPVAVGVTRPAFIVALPATGEPPWPVVLFQHGGGQSPSELFKLAGPLAEAGFAFVAIDLPHHGARAGEGGGSDLDIIDFLDPFYSRDNLRQASADHLALLAGLETLDTAVGGEVGLEDVFDSSRTFYMGLSLGGITGSMTFATASTLRGAALFVAAADYSQIVTDGLFAVFILDLLSLDDVERAIMLGFLEAFLDAADPGTYARRLEDRSLPPRPALLFQAIDDPIIPEPASDYWGLTFGASLARPFDHEVPAMTEVDLPASDTFAWPGGADRATRVLIQAPMEGVDTGDRHGGLILEGYSQRMVAHCFTTLVERGSCEAIDTGFASP